MTEACDYSKLEVRELGHEIGVDYPMHVLVYPDPVGGYSHFSYVFGMPDRPLVFPSEVEATSFLRDLQNGMAGVTGSDPRFDLLHPDDREEFSRLGPSSWLEFDQPILN